VYKNADAAVADLKSGSTILSAGFGLCGTAGKIYLPRLFGLVNLS
jgi:3-oxoacid CoA-transferase